MPAPRFRSRSLRRVFVKTPGGKTVVHHKRRKPGKPQCAMCKNYLKGVARGITFDIHKLSKTERRPERPYGGVLCSKCMRKLFVDKARKMVIKSG